MPYIIGTHNYPLVSEFLRRQEQWYLYTGRVWVQHIDMINQCTQFVFDSVERGDCEEKLPFICEIGKQKFSIFSQFVICLFCFIFFCYRSKSIHKSISMARRFIDDYSYNINRSGNYINWLCRSMLVE